MELFDERLKDIDCLRRGWILIGFPNNREQTLALQSKGICPKYVGKFD
jgi:adenylate kinase